MREEEAKEGGNDMAAPLLDTEHERALLSQAIIETLDSWPQLHRQIFSEAHYHGRSVESISSSLGMRVDTVRLILQECEGRLRSALNHFGKTPRFLCACHPSTC